MCTYREAVSLLGLAAEVSHEILGQRLEEFGGHLEFAFIDTEPAFPAGGIGCDGPHLRDGPIVAAENNRFPGLDTGKIPGKMRLGLVHVELDHKTIILVSE
jgi:hypothetical protein